MMWLVAMGLALAEPPERAPGLRVYLAGGNATVPGSGTRGAVAVGAARVTRGQQTSGAFGGELAVLDVGGGFYLPVANFDAALRWTPLPEAKVRPVISPGVGVTMVLIVPFPDLTLGLGAEVPLGEELLLDVELHGRQIFPLWPGSEPVTVTTLRLGLGF